jgi:DDE superfamily endonuclease
MVDSTASPAAGSLLGELFALLAAHRPAFRQERTYARGVALVLGWLCAFGRHTITQLLLALGVGSSDWTAWYRLLGRERVDYAQLSACLVAPTLPLAPRHEPYLVGGDATQVARHSRTMPGTTWLPHPGTAPFKRGIHRAQRFLHLAWLPLPSLTGYSRAVPLRLDPAFPAKAVPAPGHPPRKEWEAGLAALGWLRATLDGLGRRRQRIVAVGDGKYDTAPVWTDLPARLTLLARTARNRALYALPGSYRGRGRPPDYGARQPRPDAWLRVRTGWQHTEVVVRGRTIPVTYRVEGPVLVEGASERPLFLLVVKGTDRRGQKIRRDPAFWLVNAARDGAGGWRLPYPAAQLLAWAWQRWELEVAHRELKSGFGLGQPQCWSGRAAIFSVQWAAWVYAVCVLAGLRAWGLGRGPLQPPGRWWAGSGRWSLDRLWHGFRQELWGDHEFHPVSPGIRGNWWEMADWLVAKTNATLAASHI